MKKNLAHTDEKTAKGYGPSGSRSRRIILAPEERAKKGRWVIVLILLLSLLVGYANWR